MGLEVFVLWTSEHRDVIQVGKACFPCVALQVCIHEEGEGGWSIAEPVRQDLKLVELAATRGEGSLEVMLKL